MTLIALTLAFGYLLADKYMPLWMAGKRPPNMLSRIFGGKLRTDP